METEGFHCYVLADDDLVAAKTEIPKQKKNVVNYKETNLWYIQEEITGE